MNNYELTVILRKGEIESLIEKVRDILKKHGSNIVKEDSLGNKKLAYQIDGENEGYYLFLNIEAPPDSVKKITADFKLSDYLLRHLFVKIKKAESAEKRR